MRHAHKHLINITLKKLFPILWFNYCLNKRSKSLSHYFCLSHLVLSKRGQVTLLGAPLYNFAKGKFLPVANFLQVIITIRTGWLTWFLCLLPNSTLSRWTQGYQFAGFKGVRALQQLAHSIVVLPGYGLCKSAPDHIAPWMFVQGNPFACSSGQLLYTCSL